MNKKFTPVWNFGGVGAKRNHDAFTVIKLQPTEQLENGTMAR
jgi:hypothetical protein